MNYLDRNNVRFQDSYSYVVFDTYSIVDCVGQIDGKSGS